MGDVILNVIGITIFVLLIGASIALHELGHLAAAKRFGVKVTQYMIGFGPTLWSRQRGETEYGIKAIPMGGYIRMIGMYPPAKAVSGPGTTTPEDIKRESQGRFAALADEARAASQAEIGPGEDSRTFYRLPVRKRLVVMVAGPLMNLLLAFVLFTAVLVGVGLPQLTTDVGAVVPCNPTAAAPAGQLTEGGTCAVGSGPSAASAADVRPGDTIVAINGTEVKDWEGVSAALGGAQPGDTVQLSLERDGQSVTTTATLEAAERPVLDENGEPTGEVQTRAFFGIAPGSAYVPLSPTEVPAYMWDITVRSVQALFTLPAKLVELTNTLVTNGERDIDGPVSVVGVSRLGGEIAALEEPINAKIASFLGLAASLNLFLFLFNMLPLLPLDGGHAAAATYEGARRRWARRRNKPDPGPVDTAKLLPVTYAVAIVLIAAGSIVIIADLIKPITLSG